MIVTVILFFLCYNNHCYSIRALDHSSDVLREARLTYYMQTTVWDLHLQYTMPKQGKREIEHKQTVPQA